MADRLTQLKEFVQRERQVIKNFKDPDNIKAHKWYIKKSVNAMKGDILRDIDSLLRDKRTTLTRQYNNHNDELRREITELENERKDIYNYRFNDGAIMKDNQYKKIKAFLAQEFKDVKAMLKKKNFKDIVIKDSAISDARIELKMDGRTIGYIEADTLSEAVRRYEEEHPENKGKVNAYMADRRFKDSSLDDFLGDLYDNGVHSKRELVRYLVEHKDVDEARARQMVNKFAQELRNAELPIRDTGINDSLSEKAKQLISKAVSEARFDYKTAMDFAVADLKAEKEWAWTNHNEVSQMVQRLIKNRMDFGGFY